MSERLEAWLHMKEQETDLGLLEERMAPELAEKIRTELDRCIECGCCIAGCGHSAHAGEFCAARRGSIKLPASVLTVATADREDYFELIGDDDGVFGCMSLLGCHDVCPKDLPLATQIAFLRRKMVATGWK